MQSVLKVIKQSFHVDSNGRGSGPAFLNSGMGHSATEDSIGLFHLTLQNQRTFLLNVLSIESGVFPLVFFKTEENSIDCFGLCEWNASKKQSET